jgi:sulfite exporter TauE/SafE
LGGAVFFLGRFAKERLFIGPLFKYIIILGGFFIVIVGLLMLLGKRWEFKLCQFLYKNILEHDKKSIVILGIIIGILPCAPLLAILSYTGLIAKSWLEAVLYSFSFGLGTFMSPLILLVMLAGAIPKFLLDKKEIYKVFSFVCGLIIVFLGIQLIRRAF